MIYIANWKMNGVKQEITNYVDILSNHLFLDTVILALPFPYLDLSRELLSPCLYLGGQDLSHESNGAYTGSVSGKQLHDIGCKYVIIGHSERRNGCFETNDIIAQKILRSFENNLTPIVCVGENLGQNATDVLKLQLDDILPCLTGDFILAYEPVWAIGTGKIPTNNEISKINAFIYAWLEAHGLENTPILYGGSVTPQNISCLKSCDYLSGFLIGGASLKAQSFIQIITSQTI
jgi:triosephosphate isomerase